MASEPLPTTTTEYDQGRLVTRVDGRRVVTPLFVVLIAIGSTDLLFFTAVPQIPTLLSLGVIAVILVITAVASLAKVRRDPTARAHAGSVSAQGRKPASESARWSS